MKKLVQWWNDRRDRKLRERLVRRYDTVTEAEIAFQYITSGESKWEAVISKLSWAKKYDPEKYKAICATIDEIE